MDDRLFNHRINKLRTALEEERAKRFFEQRRNDLLEKQASQSTQVLAFLFGVAVEKLGGELYVSEEEFKRMAVYEFEATPDLHMTPWSSSRSRLPDTRLACRGPEPPSGSFERHRNLELLGRRQDLSLEIPEGLHTHRPSDSRPRAS